MLPADVADETNFNSRPCERGFCIKVGLISRYQKDFNSRPCERGFNLWTEVVASRSISIHAPARGASVFITFYYSDQTISIHGAVGK